MHREAIEDLTTAIGQLQEGLSQMQEIVALASDGPSQKQEIPPQVLVAKSIFEELVHSRVPYSVTDTETGSENLQLREFSTDDHDLYSACVSLFKVYFKQFTTSALTSLPVREHDESVATHRTHDDTDELSTDG